MKVLGVASVKSTAMACHGANQPNLKRNCTAEWLQSSFGLSLVEDLRFFALMKCVPLDFELIVKAELPLNRNAGNGKRRRGSRGPSRYDHSEEIIQIIKNVSLHSEAKKNFEDFHHKKTSISVPFHDLRGGLSGAFVFGHEKFLACSHPEIGAV